MKLLPTLFLAAFSLDCSEVPTEIDRLEACMIDCRTWVEKINLIFERKICQLNRFYHGYGVTCDMYRRFRRQQIDQFKTCKNELVAMKIRQERCDGQPDLRRSFFDRFHSD